MRTLVVGTGGIGGYFGALLAASKADVTVVARGEHGAAIRASGLRVESKVHPDIRVWPKVVELDSEGVPDRYDLVIVAVKGYALASVIPAIAARLRPDGCALSCLNGVESEDDLAAAFGQERVLGAVGFYGGHIARPGVIAHLAHGWLSAGAPWPSGEPALARTVSFLTEHGVRVDRSADIRVDRWYKFAWNVPFNSLTGLAGCFVSDVLADPTLLALARSLAAEVERVARATGVELGPNLVQRIIDRSYELAHLRCSLLKDLEAGRPTENDHIAGALVRIGARVGVETPFGSIVHALLRLRSPRGESVHGGAKRN